MYNLYSCCLLCVGDFAGIAVATTVHASWKEGDACDEPELASAKSGHCLGFQNVHARIFSGGRAGVDALRPNFPPE